MINNENDLENETNGDEKVKKPSKPLKPDRGPSRSKNAKKPDRGPSKSVRLNFDIPKPIAKTLVAKKRAEASKKFIKGQSRIKPKISRKISPEVLATLKKLTLDKIKALSKKNELSNADKKAIAKAMKDIASKISKSSWYKVPAKKSVKIIKEAKSESIYTKNFINTMKDFGFKVAKAKTAKKTTKKVAKKTAKKS